MNKCLNIIVYYDNDEEVKKYIYQVASFAMGKVDIALVINKDEKKLASKLIAEIKEKLSISVNVYNYGENVGYLNAMLKIVASRDVDEYSYLILSNTDIIYNDNKFFEILLHEEYESKIGCIAPNVFSAKTNSYSNPHYKERISCKKIKRNIKIFTYPRLAKVYLELANLKAKKIRKKEEESCYVYSPHGCYMIFTNSFISKISGYIYGVKLYSEESCIGELLRKSNMKCFYDSRLKLVHDESAVTGKINYKKRFMLWKESLEYILDEFY